MQYRNNWNDVGILDVVSRLGLPLVPPKSGREYLSVCPQCEAGKQEAGHHMHINPAKNVFTCIRCGYSGPPWVLARDLVGRERAIEVMNGVSHSSHREVWVDLPPDKPILDIQTRDAVYRAMLKAMVLSPSDRRGLRGRGFRDEDIERVGYKTLPSRDSLKGIAYLLQKEGYPLEGVPGFYQHEDGKWGAMWVPGFLCPFKDEKGRIQGFQVRVYNEYLDYAKHKNPQTRLKKYIWFSSTGKKGGSSPGSPIHYSIRPGVKPAVINITEGQPKAEIAALYSGQPYIAAAGVGLYQGAVEAACRLGVKKANIVYDADLKTNKYVKMHVDSLAQALKEKHMQPSACYWDLKMGKGIDDLLTSIYAGQIPINEEVVSQYLQIENLGDEVEVEITTVTVRTWIKKFQTLIGGTLR